MYSKLQQSITVTEATKKMERYCAYQERCHKDIMDKLSYMKLIPEAKEKIILHLLEHNFINEERFAKSFARGKFRIKKWGKQRIVRELKYRQISEYNIKTALKEISEQNYLQTFHELAEKKFASITETNPYKKRKKLTDYLLYRGWENQLVFEKVKDLFEQLNL
ncbi:regulatory protein RecX [Aquimarina sp. MMG016]|uniref:regulatory protein RecX n=1 Tax=Aquimarina sp. MMG016 TaxID=2822690 RepID=UPI001B39D6FB|nr:regulatory protein RecX [Aquimarina sp. MMG016]MBQ4819806.1 RecX family transcriptional regulator [Aquimarina sp. MMG016]